MSISRPKLAVATVEIKTPRDFESLDWILDLLERLGLKATFFITASLAEGHRRRVEEIASRGHELGSRGYLGVRLDKMPIADALGDIEKSVETLGNIHPVRAFRAPELKMPRRILESLPRYGITVDSSLRMGLGHPHREYGVLRLPITHGAGTLSLPWGIQKVFHSGYHRVTVLNLPVQGGRGLYGPEGPVSKTLLHYLARGYRFMVAGEVPELLAVATIL